MTISPSKPFLETVKEYAEVTTINGVLYCFDPKFSRLSQVFWFLVGIVLIIISVLLINQGYQNWQDSPILTTVSTTGLPIKDLEFPAITICGLGMVKSVLAEAIINQVSNYVMSTFKSNANLTMLPNDTYVDLLEHNHINVTQFLAAKYPHLNSSITSATGIITEEIEYYVRNKAVTAAALANNLTISNYLPLFQQFQLNYSDFLAADYSGIKPQQQNLTSLAMTIVVTYLENKTNGTANLTMSDPTNLMVLFTNNGLAYSDFLAEKYPWASGQNLSPYNIVLHEVERYIDRQIKNFPAYSLQGNETYQSFLARNNLTYTNFMTIKYPGISASSAPGDILMQQAIEYITILYKPTVNVTLLANETYRDLFTKNNVSYENFIDTMYPGLPLDMNLTDIIPILASPNPDAFLQCKLAVEGSYTPSQDILNMSHGANCDGEGYTFDPVENLCYRLAAGVGTYGSQVQFCDDADGDIVFQMLSDAQLRGFANIITKGNGTLSELALPGNQFWTDAYRSTSNDVYTNGITSDSTSFSQYNTSSPYNYVTLDAPLDDLAWNHFSLQFDKTTGTFTLSGRYDNESAIFVCVKTGNSPNLGNQNISANASLLDRLINPALMPLTADSLAIMRKDFKATFGLLDLTKAYESLFEILWYSRLPCFDIGDNDQQTNSLIKRCVWKGTELPCAAIFNTFPTDQGMCCTFNMAAADQIFYNTSYQDMILTMQETDSTGSTGQVVTTTHPDFNPVGTKLVPTAGVTKGLSLVLDAHSDLLAPGSVNQDYEGFVAIIGASDEYPLLNQKNIQIRPGHSNLVGITATDIVASDAIKNVPKEKRNCYFGDQYPLRLHQNYTQANCLLECQIEYALNATSWVDTHTNVISYCTPWFLPKNDSVEITICDPWTAETFIETMQQIPEGICDFCLPDCTFTDYVTEVTALPFRPCNTENLGVSFLCNFDSKERLNPAIYANQLAKEYGANVPAYALLPTNLRMFRKDPVGAFFKTLVGIPYDAYQVDIALVNFYFETSSVMQFSRDQSMTWTDFIGQIGGFLGLCDGFSLCSMVEIFFWFTFRLWYNTTKEKPRRLKRKLRRGLKKSSLEDNAAAAVDSRYRES